jgi:TetR/AcrR family transcriptional regulator, transcriptional repressor for nem operon
MFKIIFWLDRRGGAAHTLAADDVFLEEDRMPYPAGHSKLMRKKIIDSARKLFNRYGFDHVSIKQIMAHAGLTHGGFYSYFESKGDLYSEVVGCFFTDPEWKSCWKGVKVDLSSTDVGPQVVRAYLSRQHFEDIENSCPMVAIPSDVARSGRSAKQAFETVFQAMVSVLERSFDQNRFGKNLHRQAQATAALCVGGMVVARSMVDRAVADDLRAACMAVAHQLGGWDQPQDAKMNAASGRTGAHSTRRRRERAIAS